VVDKH